LDAGRLRRLLSAVIDHHDSLRLRMERTDGRWSQRIEPPGWDERVLSVINFSSMDRESANAELSRAAQDLQQSLNLVEGPIVRCALFDLGEGEQRLLFLVHHFACDLVSLFTVLLNDLQTGCEQLFLGQDIRLPPKTHSFGRWVAALDAYASSARANAELQSWQKLPWTDLKPLPVDFEAGPAANTNGSAKEVELRLPGDCAEALVKNVRNRIDEVLLAALAKALGDWTGADQVHLDVLNHGRRIFPELDLSRTNGFFLTYVRVFLTLGGAEATPLLEQVRVAADRGWTLDALQRLGDKLELAGLPKADVLFNFLGRPFEGEADAWLVPTNEDKGEDHDPGNLRDHPLAVVAQVVPEAVQVTFVYSENLHRRETIESLADHFCDSIRGLLHEGVPTAAE